MTSTAGAGVPLAASVALWQSLMLLRAGRLDQLARSAAAMHQAHRLQMRHARAIAAFTAHAQRITRSTG